MPIGGKGYKVPKAGKVTDMPKIGTSGNTKGEKSTEGGQMPHLPSAGSFSGRMNPSGTKSGQSEGPTSSPYPFLPPAPKRG